MSLSGMGLYDYTRIDFQLHYFLKYSHEDIENFLPYERDLLIAFFNDQKRKEADKDQEEADKMDREMRGKMNSNTYKPPSMPSMPRPPSRY
jgi:hypothetical protein